MEAQGNIRGEGRGGGKFGQTGRELMCNGTVPAATMDTMDNLGGFQGTPFRWRRRKRRTKEWPEGRKSGCWLGRQGPENGRVWGEILEPKMALEIEKHLVIQNIGGKINMKKYSTGKRFEVNVSLRVRSKKGNCDTKEGRCGAIPCQIEIY